LVIHTECALGDDVNPKGNSGNQWYVCDRATHHTITQRTLASPTPSTLTA
jgi:hypothetical protein